jgi:opacity protein-like surface antigen
MKGRLIVGALAAVPMLATAVAVQAADMGLPVYKAAPPPLLTTNWSGFYFGGHAGAAWGSTNDDFNDPTALAPFRWDSGIPVSGPLAGGQIGYNWQSGWMLFGLEADGSWSNITGHGLCNTTTFFMNCSSKTKIEYDFIDFGTKLYNFPVTSTVVAPINFAGWDFTSMIHQMKMGVNYHF